MDAPESSDTLIRGSREKCGYSLPVFNAGLHIILTVLTLLVRHRYG